MGFGGGGGAYFRKGRGVRGLLSEFYGISLQWCYFVLFKYKTGMQCSHLGVNSLSNFNSSVCNGYCPISVKYRHHSSKHGALIRYTIFQGHNTDSTLAPAIVLKTKQVVNYLKVMVEIQLKFLNKKIV